MQKTHNRLSRNPRGGIFYNTEKQFKMWIWGYKSSLKEYRKRNVSGAVYDDPRVAVAVGRFDEVVALAEA
ncbi:MAG: hypothetical protein PHF31_17000 [Methylobacter sp.]|nr:hypothetical protein [Methylobacter sp.]